MLTNLRRRAESEKGFTLIELLVVILIIGILAAIAIPAFLNQRQKGYDAQAKSNVRTAQTAEETYATDNNGTYTNAATGSGGAATDPLITLEPSLKQNPAVTATANGCYTLISTSLGNGKDVFTYTAANGTVTRACSGTGGGCVNSSW
jgi:type IV pilus assembly protein PilA